MRSDAVARARRLSHRLYALRSFGAALVAAAAGDQASTRLYSAVSDYHAPRGLGAAVEGLADVPLPRALQHLVLTPGEAAQFRRGLRSLGMNHPQQEEVAHA